MLKLPKGLKKKKKKSKKDKELFTEEELEQYKRELKAKQEAAAAKSDGGESDASDAECLTTNATTSGATATSSGTNTATTAESEQAAHVPNGATAEADEEWAKFKALTSGVDSILHKTQDELDRIKKESFYQRLPSAAEKKRQEEEEAARLEAARLEEERRKAAEVEAKRDKLAEAVVVLSDSEDEDAEEVNDIFATDYIEKITSGEVQLGIVSPDLEFDEGPDPFDTAYAEQVIVGADKAKGNKKLVSLGAAVEVLSGRVDREHALALSKPKRKQRKGITNLLLSESIDLADVDVVEREPSPEPQNNFFDQLLDDIPGSDVPIDLSVSLDLKLRPQKQQEQEVEEQAEVCNVNLDFSEFDTLNDAEDDEFAELAAESFTKKEEVKVLTEIPIPPPEVLNKTVEGDWAEFERLPKEENSGKLSRPPPPRPASGPHTITGAIFISDDEDENLDDDPFNTSYAEEVIKKTTQLEEDDEFDPRAEEQQAPSRSAVGPPAKPPPPAKYLLQQPQRDLLSGSATDLSKVGGPPIAPHIGADIEQDPEDFDPFDTSSISAIVQPKAAELRCIEKELLTEGSLKHSLSDPDFDPRSEDPVPAAVAATAIQFSVNSTPDFDTARRKSSLSLSLQSKTVGFLVPDQDLLALANDSSKVQKPLTPYYAPKSESIAEKEPEDPFDTSNVPESKPTQVELKHLEKDLLEKANILKHSVSDPDFDPRAPETPLPVEDLLSVQENINTKVLTPAQESKDLSDGLEEILDPFDTSLVEANIQPGKAELKLLESELLPEIKPEINTGVLDTQTDAQELGLGDKVLTPSLPVKQLTLPEDIDPFDTSIAENLQPGETEIKLLENELIQN